MKLCDIARPLAAAVAMSAAFLTSTVLAQGPDTSAPAAASAFASIKVYGADGSPVRVPLEDWEGARKRSTSDPSWRSWVDSQRAEMDDWMTNRHDHVEWLAGWFHDFVSPKDGSHLIWTPDEPGESTLRSASDPSVKLTPKLRDAWVYEFRNRNASHMREAAELYRLTGEKKYADWAAGQIDFYADNFDKWPRRRPDAHLMFQSLDEAVDLIMYVQTARLLGDIVTPERKQRWFTKLFQPECATLNKSMLMVHNIACWDRSAVGCVGLYYDDPALLSFALDSKFGIRKQVNEGVTADYLWREQSMAYNAYVVSALMPFFELACETGHKALVEGEMEKIENLMLSPISLRFPTGQLPNPADEGAPSTAPNLDFLADAARLFPTTLGVAAAANRRDWWSLIDPLPAPARPPTLPEVTSRNLEASRMAVIRKGHWQVYFHYGQLTASHSQAEALNYEAFYDKTDVSHDSGTVGYGSPMYRDYYSTGLAHNVPLIDGQGQKGWNPGKLASFDGAAASVTAIQPTYSPNVSAERSLSTDGDRLTDVVTVKTTGGTPHEIGLLVQIQGKPALPASFQPDDLLAKAPGAPKGFAYWKDVTTASFTDKATFDVTYADSRKLRLTLATNGPFTVTHASVPDAPPHRRDVLYVRTTGKTEGKFTTIYSQDQ